MSPTPGILRKKLRDLLVQQIQDAGTAAGQAVESNRADPIDAGTQLPRVIVSTLDEEVLDDSRAAYYEVQEGVVLECFVDGTSQGWDDTVEYLSDQVYAVVTQALGIGGRATDADLACVQQPYYQGSELTAEVLGQRVVGVVRMAFAYRATISSQPGDPSQITDFAGINTQWEQPPADVDVDATDTIDLETE